MKFIITIGIVLTGFLGMTQNKQNNDNGFRLKVHSSLNSMLIGHKLTDEVTLDNGTRTEISQSSQTKGGGLGGRVQAGYQINNNWTFGVQGGIFVRTYFNYVFPVFEAYTSLGACAQYDFNDRFSMQATFDNFKIPNRQPGLAFGIAPEYVVGKKKDIGLRFSLQYHHARKQKSYSDHFLYEPDNMMYYHEGTGESVSNGVLLELGLTFKIRD